MVALMGESPPRPDPDKGWSLAADELQFHAETVMRWKAGIAYPWDARPVMLALKALSRRWRIPKRRITQEAAQLE